MKYQKLALSLAVAAACLAPLSNTYAYEKGDIILRAGPAVVDPDSSSSAIRLGGAELAGTAVSVEDDTQLGLTATYMLGDNFGIGLLASTPFEHEIRSTGLGLDRIGSTKHLPPTLSLQYFPVGGAAAFQPYVGLGVNYTTFFDEETDAGLDAALGNTSMKLDDSFGIALEVGVDYALSDRWALNAAIWLIDIDTDATINSNVGQVTVDVDIDPTVYMLGLAYKF